MERERAKPKMAGHFPLIVTPTKGMQGKHKAPETQTVTQTDIYKDREDF